MTEQKALVPIGQKVENALIARESFLSAIFGGDEGKVRRFIKTAAVAVARNPDLGACTMESIVTSCVEAAEAGIEPTGSLSRGWLVPFREKGGVAKAQFILGWMGMIDLAKQSGEVRKIIARCVYEGDDFIVEQGTVERIVHVPRYQTDDPTKISHIYAVAMFRDGSTIHEVMTHAQVEGVRAMSRARNAAAWTESWPEMARKTVVRRLAKYLKLTPEAITAIERDDEREFGRPEPVEPTARTASLRDALRAQAAPQEAVEVEGEAVEVAPEASADPQPEATPAADEPTGCPIASPYDPPADCILAAGHKGHHRSAEKVSW